MVGYNTETGDMSNTEYCFGQHPILCPPTPMHEHDFLTCEKGLITQHHDDSTQCAYEDRPMPTKSQLQRHGRSWVITTKGEDLALSCEGKPQVRTTVHLGAYLANIPSACTLDGETWTIRGEIMGESHYVISYNDTMPLEQMNFQNEDGTTMILPPLPSYDRPGTLDSHTKLDHERLSDIHDRLTDLEYSDDYFPTTAHGISTWIVIGIIAAVIAVLSLAAYKLYQRRKLLAFALALPRKLKKTKAPKDITNDIEALPLEDIPECSPGNDEQNA